MVCLKNQQHHSKHDCQSEYLSLVVGDILDWIILCCWGRSVHRRQHFRSLPQLEASGSPMAIWQPKTSLDITKCTILLAEGSSHHLPFHSAPFSSTWVFSSARVCGRAFSHSRHFGTKPWEQRGQCQASVSKRQDAELCVTHPDCTDTISL